jgi:hypothetical protein
MGPSDDPKPRKPFFIRMMIGGHTVDLPGLWGVAALVYLAGIIGYVVFLVVMVLNR